ncbi:MAG: GGDEF domain-containing protein [Hydrogenophilales bacterium]|nr:GGDEF domain-containing protein [Hydrogenophilales bacterium]
MSSINRKILAIYLLALVAGIAISTLTYLRGESVLRAGSALTEQSLPRFDTISHLRNAIFSQKPVLYEYYATADRTAFLTRYNAAREQTLLGLRALRDMNQALPEMARLEAGIDRIHTQSKRLDQTMNSTPVDWDRAREILAEVSEAEARITPELEALVQINRQQVIHYSQETRGNTMSMMQMVLGLTLAGLIMALFIAYYVNAYLRDTAHRRLLAIFPERSPNPMLRLSEAGEVLFANDATHDLIGLLGLTDVEEILPLDLELHLMQLNAAGQQRLTWEYSVGEHTLDCTVHLLPDLHVCHLYLADITERKQAELRLVRQALQDAVTGLPNRRLFRERLEITLNHEQAHCAVALIRPDRIKLVLESQGYAASDNLIGAMAERLMAALSEHPGHAPAVDIFRFEGATFGLLITQLADTSELDLLMRRLQAAMLEPLKVEEREFFFTLSIGVAVSPHHGADAETLFKNAEAAVNRIRSEGGNGFRFYTQDLSERTEQWLAMEQGLRRALERNELLLHYQPQVNLKSGEIIGAEALIRWQNPERGLIPPMQFIPLAEETGLIVPIGAWVLRTACLQAKTWLDLGNDLVMAVNISARQFQHPGFIDLVEEVLAETGLPAQHLELEITESVAMHDAERTTATLHALRQIGIQLSIDDFGTGFSSLAYLRRFPLSKLKVDQSFVRNLSVNEYDATIAHTVILLGHSLQLTVIAEGVETKEQLDVLRRLGCEEMQGYYFSRPVPAADLSALLKEGRRLAA